MFLVLSIVQQIRISWALSVRSTLWCNSLLQNFWEWLAVLLGIQIVISNTKISENLGVNLKTDSYWWKPNTLSTLWGGHKWWQCYGSIHLPKWIKRVAVGRSHFWQQDTALCHTSRRLKCSLSEHFCCYIIPNIWLPRIQSSRILCVRYGWVRDQ